MRRTAGALANPSVREALKQSLEDAMADVVGEAERVVVEKMETPYQLNAASDEGSSHLLIVSFLFFPIPDGSTVNSSGTAPSLGGNSTTAQLSSLREHSAGSRTVRGEQLRSAKGLVSLWNALLQDELSSVYRNELLHTIELTRYNPKPEILWWAPCC
eukprot:GHVS01079317.1.p1 GENE.GHVS01079317.1~~GHVS01079317.1.p1  ORF type:complete len:158 (-),score=23.26 GHVS01079317.1:927-1400(-)